MDDDLQALEHRLASVTRELQRALMQLLQTAVGKELRPRTVCDVFAISRQLASKLLIALRSENVLAAAFLMPGHEALRQVLQSTPASLVSSDAYRLAKRAIDDFELTIEDELGGRAFLECLVGGRLDEARLQSEMRGRQLAFRGLSLTRGSIIDTIISTRVLSRPQGQQRLCRSATITAWLGMRRLRAGVSHRLVEYNSKSSLSLAGSRIHDDPASALVEEYCSRPLPIVEFIREDDKIIFQIAGNNHIGKRSPADLCWATFGPPSVPSHTEKPQIRRSFFCIAFSPAKRLVFDIYLPASVWPGSDPQLVVRDTAYGDTRHVDEFPGSRPTDALDTSDRIQVLGPGLSRAELPPAPWYSELLTRACHSLDVAPDEMRGYRCAIDYPLHGAMHHMLFRVPPSV